MRRDGSSHDRKALIALMMLRARSKRRRVRSEEVAGVGKGSGSSHGAFTRRLRRHGAACRGHVRYGRKHLCSILQVWSGALKSVCSQLPSSSQRSKRVWAVSLLFCSAL